jgi:hypothetical protein
VTRREEPQRCSDAVDYRRNDWLVLSRLSLELGAGEVRHMGVRISYVPCGYACEQTYGDHWRARSSQCSPIVRYGHEDGESLLIRELTLHPTRTRVRLRDIPSSMRRRNGRHDCNNTYLNVSECGPQLPPRAQTKLTLGILLRMRTCSLAVDLFSTITLHMSGARFAESATVRALRNGSALFGNML